MQQTTRVVLALDAPEVVEEILHLLDRSGAAQVVATATDPRQLQEACRQLEPDLVVAEPRLAPHTPPPTPCVAVASRESVPALRAALEARARAFLVWPRERDELLEHVRTLRSWSHDLERRATVVAIHASRGGAGCTFMATHLAQAIAATDVTCALIDVDPDRSDVGTALGIPDDDAGVHTLRELADVADELTLERFRDVVWSHPAGFGVVVAPPAAAKVIEPVAASRVIDVAAAAVDVVLLHTAPGLDDVTRTSIASADVSLEVLSLDVASFRASSRTVARMAADEAEPRIAFVVNRAQRAEVVPGDVERVFGAPARAVIPFDGAVPRLQDHGRLLPVRSRTARAIARLAADLLQPDTAERGAA